MKKWLFFGVLVIGISYQASSQFGFLFKEGIEVFSRSAAKRELAEELERCLGTSLKFKSETEAFDFLKKSSLSIQNGYANPIYHDLRNGLTLTDNSIVVGRGYGRLSDEDV